MFRCFVFEEASKVFFRVAVSLYIPYQQCVKDWVCLHPHQHLALHYSFFNFSSSNRCAVISYHSLNWHFFMAIGVEHPLVWFVVGGFLVVWVLFLFFFFCPLPTCFGEMSSEVFCLFLNWIVFQLLSFWEFSICSRYQSYVRYVAHKYFLPICSFFVPLTGSLEGQIFNFD